MQKSNPQSSDRIPIFRCFLNLLGQFCELFGRNGLFGHLDLGLHVLDHLHLIQLLVDLLSLLAVLENLLGVIGQHIFRSRRQSVLSELGLCQRLGLCSSLFGGYRKVILLDEIFLEIIPSEQFYESVEILLDLLLGELAFVDDVQPALEELDRHGQPGFSSTGNHATAT